MLELGRVKDLRAKISTLEQKLECIKVISISPPKLGLPRSQARSSSTERIAIQIVEIENELATLRTELDKVRENLITAILDRVSEPIRATCLVLYYTTETTQKEISERLNCPRRKVYEYLKEGKEEYKAQG